MSRHNIDHDHEHGMILLKALRPHKGYKYQANYTEKQGRGRTGTLRERGYMRRKLQDSEPERQLKCK